jgi:hypothetical protein
MRRATARNQSISTTNRGVNDGGIYIAHSTHIPDGSRWGADRVYNTACDYEFARVIVDATSEIHSCGSLEVESLLQTHKDNVHVLTRSKHFRDLSDIQTLIYISEGAHYSFASYLRYDLQDRVLLTSSLPRTVVIKPASSNKVEDLD